MHFHQQAVSSNSNSSTRKRCDLVALASAVAGIDQDREMAQTLHRRNYAEVERVARVVGEGAHATFAECDIIVAFAEDVFGGHQKFLERGRHAAFEEHGLAGASGALE